MCDGTPMHDAHTVAYAIEPSMYTNVTTLAVQVFAVPPLSPSHLTSHVTASRSPQVLVTPAERLSHGMSLVDRRCPPPHVCAGKAARQFGQVAPLVRVLLGIDAPKFNAAFAAHMARLPSE